jgi:hypothetical protein
MFGIKKSNDQMASEYSKKRISYKNVFSTLIILVLFGAIFYMGHYTTGQISRLNSKNTSIVNENAKIASELEIVKASNAVLVQEKRELVSEIEAIKQQQKENEFEEKGINPEAIEINKLSVTGSWKVSTFSYNLAAAYYIDDISDLGELREDPDLQEMNFLMMEIDVVDTRTKGEERNVPINDYLQLVEGNISAYPFTEEYLNLNPGANGKVYVGFAVEPDSMQFELRSGYSSNPNISQLDFESQNTQKLSGVFMLTKGFAEKYIE